MAKAAQKKQEVAAQADTAKMTEILRATVAAAPATVKVDNGAAEVQELTKLGMIELHPNGPGSDGQIEAKATEAGKARVAAGNEGNENMADNGNTGAAADNTATVADEFEIMDAPAVPAAGQRGRRGSKYPFDKLAVGKGFFVAKSDKMAEPWNSLRSTVTQEERKNATITGTQPVMKDGVAQTNKDGSPKMRNTYSKAVEYSVFAGTKEAGATDASKATGAWVVRTK